MFFNQFFFKKYLYVILIIIVVSICTYFWLNLLNNFFLKNIFFGICWFYVFYWLISIFIFLLKKSQFTIFTSIIQRFWKRSLYLFWLIELFLFIIYLFLTLISPQEPLYMMDHFFLYFNYIGNLKFFFINIFKIIVIILLFNILLIQHKYNSLNIFIHYLLLLLLLGILFDDFSQFYYIHQYYQYYQWVYDVRLNSWNLDHSDLKFRTGAHYFYILIFLKFWHTVFIVVFFLFFENFLFFKKHNSYNIISANLQNMYFLLFFAFILKILYFKYYMNILYDYIYYWFFINFHFNNYIIFYKLFSFDYFIFLYTDFKNCLNNFC